MKVWKVIAALAVGIALTILALWMWIIWGDSSAIDEKLTNTILVLIVIEMGLWWAAVHFDEGGQ